MGGSPKSHLGSISARHKWGETRKKERNLRKSERSNGETGAPGGSYEWRHHTLVVLIGRV